MEFCKVIRFSYNIFEKLKFDLPDIVRITLSCEILKITFFQAN